MFDNEFMRESGPFEAIRFSSRTMSSQNMKVLINEQDLLSIELTDVLQGCIVCITNSTERMFRGHAGMKSTS